MPSELCLTEVWKIKWPSSVEVLATSVALWAKASVISRSGDNPASAASPVSDRAAVKARRVMIKGLLPDGAFRARCQFKTPFASLKRPMWQWRLATARRGQSLNFA